jgi:hypothetical protein
LAYIGAEYCKKCHREKTESKIDVCRLTEYHYWENQDRHRIAWSVLQGPRAKQIGALLERDRGEGDKDVSHDPRCISCHAVDTSTLGPPPRNQLVQQYKYSLEEGISCVECHGPYLEWVAYHGLPTREWRDIPREKKESEKGMRDLWNPLTRTRLCLSCHLGDPDPKKKRFVTHEMYAAGHPPLPGIEIAAFSDEQPRHWQYLREKDEEIRKLLEFRSGRMEQTELIAVSGLVTLRRALELLAVPAEPESDGRPAPDFARYDCYACHHELRSPGLSWRQARGTEAAPGRPLAPSWPGALAVLSIVAADPRLAAEREVQFRDHIRSVHAALASQPFGNRAEIVGSVQRFTQWADQILGELADLTKPQPKDAPQAPQPARIIGRAAAIAMLQRLCELAIQRIPDYDSARQMAWACRSLYEELTPQPAPDDPVIKELKLLDRQLVLTLHPHTGARDLFPTKSEQKPILEGEGFLQRLKAVAEYDPSLVQSRFTSIVKHLPQR